MTGLHWFPFFPQQYLSSPAVMAMLPEQQGAYWKLLALSWGNGDECPSLPADDATLAALSGLQKRWKALGPLVRAQFEEVNGRLWNERLSAVWQEQQSKHERASQRGKTGGRAKAAKGKHSSSTSTVQAENSQSTSVDSGKHIEVELEEAVRSEPLTGSVLPASPPAALAADMPRAPADGTTLPWRNTGPAVEAETARLEAEYFRRLSDRADVWIAENPDDAAELERTTRVDLGLHNAELTDFQRRAVRESMLVTIREARGWPSSEVWIANERLKLMGETVAA